MKHLYYLMSLVLFAQLAIAQGTISGNITDDEGVPLPGATVLVKGTNNGTTTDFDGNFSIQANVGDVLNISYVGYESVNQTVNNQDSISVSLSAANELEEVVLTCTWY
jgi:hypothetical protein